MVNLVAKPHEGYKFVNWTGDVGTIAAVNNATTIITMSGNYSITANFVAVAVYNLTISSTAGGNVTTPGEAGPYTYNRGTKVKLVAIPDACCNFVNWTGNVGTIADVNTTTTTITMNGDYSITANFEEEEAVTFPDPNLEAAIREAIAIPVGTIYASDLGGLTYLFASENNIADLTGLEYATTLTNLVLGNNTISDISALANLTSLTGLYLSDNLISDISPVANLTSLTDLQLSANQIIDISPLANLTSMAYLTLGSNQISDISPLVQNLGLGTGDDLDLQDNPLSSASINIYIPQLEARGVIVSY